MKKTFVTIKDITWYDENKDDHGIVYLDPANDSDFFSRGQSEFLGRLSEVISIDKSNNYKLQIDNAEYIWKEWQFSNIEEKEINNEDVIDVSYNNIEEDIISKDKEIHELFEKDVTKSLQIEDKSSIEFQTDIIKSISDWNLNFLLGTAVTNIIQASKVNIKEYENNLYIAILCLQNELAEVEKGKINEK